MISREAQKFWNLIRSFRRQIDMNLAEARAADLLVEDFTAEPAGVTFTPATELDGIWAEAVQGASNGWILYFFGGAFALGTPATRRKTAGHLALAGNARVLVPNYRLAPEHPFPAGLEDAVRAYEWLLAQGAEPSRIFIAGDSAGANLSLSTVLSARDRGLPKCAGVVLICPWVDLTCSGGSMQSRSATDIICDRAGLLRMAADYLQGKDPRNPLASPLFADLTDVPPLLCLVGGDEMLLDDSVRLVRSAGIAGVDATLRVSPAQRYRRGNAACISYLGWFFPRSRRGNCINW